MCEWEKDGSGKYFTGERERANLARYIPSRTTGTILFRVPFTDIRHLWITFDLINKSQPYGYCVVYKMIADQEQPCSSTAAQDRATQSPALRRTSTETVRNRRASESVQHRERRLAQERATYGTWVSPACQKCSAHSDPRLSLGQKS